MSKQIDIISDFEELFKLKEFYKNNKKEPYECTYELISHSLKNEDIDNIDSKIERWINISHVLYFKDVPPVKFYLQAKMLFRDGFYEAAITLSRSICEMICYEKLTKMSHPFGKPIGRAARVRPGQKIMSVLIDEENLKHVKTSLTKVKSKISCKTSVRIGTNIESIGTLPKRIKKRMEAKEKEEEKEEETKEGKGKKEEKGKEEKDEGKGKGKKEEKKDDKKDDKSKDAKKKK